MLGPDAVVYPFSGGSGPVLCDVERSASMNLQSKQSQLRQKHALRFQVVTTELDLALTFCLVAAAPNDQAKAHRNIANAEQAYASAAYLMDGSLNAAQNFEIRKKLIRLNSLMAGCDRNALSFLNKERHLVTASGLTKTLTA
jgi:hypothetical protein